MSIVGPRPLMEKQFFMYDHKQQLIISKMRPGLTSYASIYFRDEERFFTPGVDVDTVYSSIISPTKARIEMWYSKNRKIWHYFHVIIATAYVVIKPNVVVQKVLPKALWKDLKSNV